jgi:hypothetical protein
MIIFDAFSFTVTEDASYNAAHLVIRNGERHLMSSVAGNTGNGFDSLLSF